MTDIGRLSCSVFKPLLYFSALLFTGWGKTEVIPLCSAQNGQGSRLLTLSQWGKLLFQAGEFPLLTEQCLPGGMGWCWQNEVVIPYFFCGYSQVFGSAVLLKFLSGFLSSPIASFVCGKLFNCWSLLGDGGWGFLLYHFGDVTVGDLWFTSCMLFWIPFETSAN